MRQVNGDFMCGQDGPISEAARKEIEYFRAYLKAGGRRKLGMDFKAWHTQQRNAAPAVAPESQHETT